MTGDLRTWRLSEDRFDALLQLRAQPGAVDVSTLLSAAARLHRASLNEVGSLASLIAAQPALKRHHEPLAEAILGAVLQSVDAPLQTLYHQHLNDAPVMPHWERVQSLEQVREQAFALVHAFDWAWLARWFGRDGAEGEAWCLRRLSNLAFPCRYLNLRFTYHCNIRCRHCYNDSGPDRRRDRLDLQHMLSLVRDMPGAGIPGLNLTGGEPFLYPDDVLSLVREARRRGVTTIRIFTNGFWARSADAATQTLLQLQQAGFGASPTDLLKVSAGSFHREFLGDDLIARIADAHFAIFRRPIEADIEIDPSGDDRSKPVTYWTAAAGTRAAVVIRDVSAVGRGLEVAGDGGDGGRTPCRLIDQLAVEPDGAVRPCCGLNAQNSGVRIANAQQQSLREMVKRMQNDPLLQVVATTPMREVFTLVGKTAPATGRMCELCQAAVGDLTDREPVLASLQTHQRYYPFWFSDPPGLRT